MRKKNHNLKIILTTHDDLIQARDLAQILVESRAAACVNIVPNIMSVFTWEGELQHENEILLLIKTTAENVPEVQALLEDNHSYEVPEIVALDGEVLNRPYMDWLLDCLQP